MTTPQSGPRPRRSAQANQRTGMPLPQGSGRAPAPSRRAIKGTPAQRHTPKRKKHHYVRNTFLTLLILALMAVLAAFALFLTAYATTQVPSPNQFARTQVTTIYYNDGKTELGKFAEVNRVIIDASKLPKVVGNAVVSSEDRTFWTNNGVDPIGIARAFYNNIRGGKTQGASTLSQQYVEMYYLGENQAKGSFFQRYWGKAKEAIMALKINRQQSKEEILGNYLNTIYFGRSAYGIEAAAQAYFGISAEKLDYSQAALLAGIIPGPSLYDPAVDANAAQLRWSRVIKLMAEDGYITPEQAAAAQFPATIEPGQSKQNLGGTKGYFLEQVRNELHAADFSDSQIETMGLKIITTLDKEKQDLMEASVAKLPAGYAPNLRVAMVSTDPTTGEIIAEYPGADYLQIQRNAVTQDRYQAGSTFKIFGLLAGLEAGKKLTSVYNGNSPKTFAGNSKPVTNFAGISYGMVTLAKATAYSINTAYASLNEQIGADKTREMAVRLGLPEDTAGLDDTLTNILGSASPHALDMATAYGTIVNEGVRQDAHIIRQVQDTAGDVIYMPLATNKRVVEQRYAAQAIQAMEGVMSYGTAKEVKLKDRPSAGKTGSASDNKAASFVGVIPQMVTVVAMYQVGPNGEEERITPWGGEREITGSTWPAWLWNKYMTQATAGLEVEKFAKPRTTSTPTPSRTITEEAPREETEPSPSPTLSPSESPSPTSSEGATIPGNGTGNGNGNANGNAGTAGGGNGTENANPNATNPGNGNGNGNQSEPSTATSPLPSTPATLQPSAPAEVPSPDVAPTVAPAPSAATTG